jgi:hypothetical protein
VYLRWAFVVHRLVSDGALGLGSRARRHLGHTNREIQGGGACDARVEVGPLHQGRLDGILLASFSKEGPVSSRRGLTPAGPRKGQGAGPRHSTTQHSAARSVQVGVLRRTSLYIGMPRAGSK